MQYKVLGKSDLNISQLSFGCMSMGQDEVENAQLISQAIQNGFNLFDTADLYQQGSNEVSLGKALKGKRKSVYIATKVGNRWNNDGKTWEWCPDKAYILKAVEESLSRLNTDYIDLYQLHGGTLEDPIDGIIEAFEILQAQGKIRYYGISSIRPNVIRTYLNRSKLTSVMMQYSLLDRRPEEEILKLLKENNVGVLARGALAQGLLVDKPAKPYLANSSETVDFMQRTVNDLASDKRNSASVAIGFVLGNKAVTSATLGIRNGQQLQQIYESYTAIGLSPSDLEKLNKNAPVLYYEQHR